MESMCCLNQTINTFGDLNGGAINIQTCFDVLYQYRRNLTMPGQVLASPGAFNSSLVVNMSQALAGWIDNINTKVSYFEIKFNQSYSKRCYEDFKDAQNTTINAATLLNTYAMKNDTASKDAFLKACNESSCDEALKNLLSTMDNHYDKDCHILARMYDKSMYTDGLMYKGFKDYYL